ncbi:hypothetical protein M3Y95_01244900 [Aphelenchoides besseyi]|nr:hypothetical protein M3Y95_01244900 [Aphelenchoides besseyi]
MVPTTVTPLAYGEYVYQMFASLLAFVLHFVVIYKLWKYSIQKQLSLNLVVNVVFWIFAMFASFLYSCIMVGLGSTSENLYKTQLVFWFGTLLSAMSGAVSISIAFLTLDRIYLLQMPVQYHYQRRRFIFATIVMSLSIIVFIVVLLPIVEMPLPELTACPSYSCLLKESRGMVTTAPKMFIGLLNTILAIVLYRKLKKKRPIGLNKNFQRANNVAMLSIITELWFHFIPNAINLFFFYNRIPYWNLFGPLTLDFFATDSIISGLVILVVIARKPKAKRALGFSTMAIIIGATRRWSKSTHRPVNVSSL